MDSLQYLIRKSSSNSNKNLDKLSKFFSQEELNKLSQKSVSIVGTNGKTTTATVLNNILSNTGLTSLSNPTNPSALLGVNFLDVSPCSSKSVFEYRDISSQRLGRDHGDVR
mgnify:CR=1 FL=1